MYYIYEILKELIIRLQYLLRWLNSTNRSK